MVQLVLWGQPIGESRRERRLTDAAIDKVIRERGEDVGTGELAVSDPELASALARGREKINDPRQHRAFRAGLEELVEWHDEIGDYSRRLGQSLKDARAGDDDIPDNEWDALGARNDMLLDMAKRAGPEKGRAMLEQANQSGNFFGIGELLGDVRERSRKLADDAYALQVDQAKFLRGEANSEVEQWIDHNARMKEAAGILETVPDGQTVEGLQLTKLLELYGKSARGLTTDPDDLGDALTGAGASVPVVGSVLALAGGWLSAQDFKLSKEQFAELLRAQDRVMRDQYETRVMALGDAAGKLAEATAGDERFRDYNLADVVMLNSFDPSTLAESPFKDQYDDTRADGEAPAPIVPRTSDELEREIAANEAEAAAQSRRPLSSFTDLPPATRQQIADVEAALGPITLVDGRTAVDQQGNPVQLGAGVLAQLRKRTSRDRSRAMGRAAELASRRDLIRQNQNRSTDEYNATQGGF